MHISVCKYACASVCIYSCAGENVCMDACAYPTSTHVRMCSGHHGCLKQNLNIGMYACMYARVYALCACSHKHMHAHIHTRTHIHQPKGKFIENKNVKSKFSCYYKDMNSFTHEHTQAHICHLRREFVENTVKN